MKKLDLTGQKFGRLTVLSQAPNHTGRCAWNCVCECGNHVIAITKSLRNGDKQSCGCLNEELAKDRKTKHGETGSRLFVIWVNMRRRCQNLKDAAYDNYGGRGITITSDWDEFADFKKWADESGYAPTLTLDRIDVNGNYCPENCRWISDLEQARNMRKNIRYNGKCVAEWCDELHINRHTVYTRIERGWPVEKALFSPIGPNGSRRQ